MSLATALLNAQRRPAAEARRLTAAIAEELNRTELDGDGAVRAALTAAEGVSQKIADEKAPPPPPRPTDAADPFVDQPPIAFADTDQPGPTSIRTDSRFLLTDPETLEATPVSDDPKPPWRVDDDPDVQPGSAPPPPPEPDPAEVATGGEPEPPESSTTADAGGATLGEPLGMRSGPRPAQPEPAEAEEGTQEPRRTPWEPPSPTDGYGEADFPWSSGTEEVVLSDDETDDETDDDEPEDETEPGGAAYDDLPPDDVTPAATATAPPSDMPAPTPDASRSLRERLSGLGPKLRRIPKRVLVVLLVLVVVTVGVLVLTLGRGDRGRPPEPAGAGQLPADSGDDPEPSPDEQLLVPWEVSASCSNDSDPVAPFVQEKTRAWECYRERGMDGSVLNMTFKCYVVITKILIVPGFNYAAAADGRDEWGRHRLTTGVTWRAGGQVFPQSITPSRTGVAKQFPSVVTKEMSMTITSTTRPPKGADQKRTGIASPADDDTKVDETTAISRIEIYGRPLDPGAPC